MMTARSNRATRTNRSARAPAIAHPAGIAWRASTRAVLAASLGACIAASSLAACVESKSAGAGGNVVIDDTREQPRPPPNPDPPIDANIPDAPLYDALGDYQPLAACNGCTCS